MAIISTYPTAIATSNDLLVGTQVSTAGTQINPTKNFTIDSIRDLVGRYLVTGLVNNLGSQASGFDKASCLYASPVPSCCQPAAFRVLGNRIFLRCNLGFCRS